MESDAGWQSKLNITHLLVVPLTLVALLMGVVGGVALDRTVLGASVPVREAASVAGTQPDFALIKEAWTLINARFVDRQAIESERLTYGAISGMVAALGDTGHTMLLTPQMLQAEQTRINGSFEGIGAEVEMRNGYVVIVTPIDGSPAAAAGLHPGDVILKVDGKDMTGETFDTVLGKIRGPAGTQVTLTVGDPQTGALRDVAITRAKIILHSVTWHMLPGTTIAHVRLSDFSKGMTDDMVKAIKEAQAQGATGIILDMRNNPGGLLDEAVSASSQFLKDGNVLLTQDAQGRQRPTPVQSGGVATDIPLVVLINEGSASASEITAAALQDAGRAKLIGSTTFGTGTVLNQFKLSDGSALLVATEEWLSPKGRVIWHQGVAPDIEVKLASDIVLLFPSGEKDLTADQLNASDDAQLLAAIKELQQSSAQTSAK
jgi:carboxyl-terminal processing protease